MQKTANRQIEKKSQRAGTILASAHLNTVSSS